MTQRAEMTVDLTWEDLKYTVDVKDDDGKTVGKELLHGISGTARHARTLAVMGPSGAGKSTFLNGICGRLQADSTHRLEGTAYLNDVLFLSKYKQLVSYVAQDDIVMGKDTPREALTFSYRLRSGATAEDATTVVDEMIAKLSLGKAADTLLGVPGLIKGVSGGEKKRTNIGAELINNPLILLLDEPTTGLDSVNALRVGQLLRDLANNDQRTVICTIHTPSSELYAVFDDLLLLAKGSVVYHGSCEDAPAYFASIDRSVPLRMNPSEHFMNLLQEPEEGLNQMIQQWKDFVASPAGANNRCVNQTPKEVRKRDDRFEQLVNKRTISKFGELMLLTGRAARITFRDPAATFGRLFQTLFFAVFLALLFANLEKNDNGVTDRAGVLFMQVMNLMFMNVMTALATFPPERAVFLQEQTSGMYSAVNYYISKCIAELPLMIAFPLIYVIITYFSWDLALDPTAFFNHLAIAIVLSYTANAFGLFAAALFPRPEIAFTITPLMLMPQMLVGGLFANTERLEPGWVWLTYISFPRYGYKAFFVNEFDHVGSMCPGGGCRYSNGQDVINFFGFDKETDSVWFNIIIMLIIMMVFRCFGALGLHVQGAARRSEMVFEANYKHLNKGFVSKHGSRAQTPREHTTTTIVQPTQDEQELAAHVAAQLDEPTVHTDPTHEPVNE
jgi:ABC-type multidrug transport system ATPase subunit